MSLIFQTVNNDLTSLITGTTTLINKIGILGVSFEDLFLAYQAFGAKGVLNSFSETITKMDIPMLQNFLTATQHGIPAAQAFEDTMVGASKAAKTLAMSGNLTEETLRTLQATEISTTIATQALTLAFNIGLTLAVTGLIYLISDLVRAEEEARQKAIETGEATAREAENIQQLKQAYDEAVAAYDGSTESKNNMVSAAKTLAEALGMEQSVVQDLTGDYQGLKQAIDEAYIASLNEMLPKLKAAAIAAEQEFEKGFNYKFGRDPINQINDTGFDGKAAGLLIKNGLAKREFADSMSWLEFGSAENLEEKIALYNKFIAARKLLSENLTEDELRESNIYTALNEKIAGLEDSLGQLNDAYKALNETTAEKEYSKYILDNGIPETVDDFIKMKEALLGNAKANNDYIGSQEQVANAIDDVIQGKSELTSILEQYNTEIKQASNYVDRFAVNQAESMDKTIEKNNEVSESISKINSALNGQGTGSSISFETFNADELKDYQSALETVNGTMQINAERAKEITKAKVEEQIAVNDLTKAQEQSKYIENIKQIEILRKQLANATDATDTFKQSIREKIAEYQKANDGIISNCDSLDLMNANLRESIGLYQEWKDAQNATESGDMFDDALKAFQTINDVLNNAESELFGRENRSDYLASVAWLIPESVTEKDKEHINKYLDSIKDLFVFDDDGKRTGLDIQGFLQKAHDELGSDFVDIVDGEFVVAGQKSIEDFAEGMNLSLPLVQAIFGEINEFTPIDWASDGQESFADLGEEIFSVTNEINALQQAIDLINNQDVKTRADETELENLNAQLDAALSKQAELAQKASDGVMAYADINKQLENAKTELAEIQANKDGDIWVDAHIEQAKKKIADLEAQKAQLSEPTELEIQVVLDDITSKIDAKKAEIANYNDGGYLVSMDISDKEAQEKLATLNQELSELEKQKKEVEVLAKTDDANNALEEIAQITIDDKEFSVVAHTSEARDAVSRLDRAIRNLPDNKNIKITTTQVSTGGGLFGLGHASGTAKANGDWGNKNPGRALVGELGRELVVDPYTGRWRTVGNNGTEFAYIPKNAIVFNHIQTEELLKNGFTATRGLALANGTAFAGGSNPSFSISVEKTKTVTTAKQEAGKSTETSTKTTTSSSKENTSSSTKEKDPKTNDNYYNYFEAELKNREKAIEKYEKELENLNKKMAEALENNDMELFNSLKESYDSTSKEYRDYLAKSAGEMRDLANEQIYPIVFKFAPELAGKSVDEWDEKTILDIKKRVDDKLIELENAEGDTKEIEKERKEYEALSDTLENLYDVVGTENGQGEWSEKWSDSLKEWRENCIKEFDEVQESYERKLDEISNAANDINNHISLLEVQGYEVNDELTRQLIANKEQENAILAEEKAQLETKLQELVAIGAIIEGSDEYYEKLKQIRSIGDEITENEIDIAKHNKELDEYDRHISIFEKALSRLNDTLNKISTWASSAYKSFKNRGNYMIEEANQMRVMIAQVNDEIELLQNRLDNLNLPDDIMAAIKNGTIDVKSIQDEDLSKAVQDAVKDYDRLLELQNTSIEYSEKLSSIYMDMFDNVSNKYAARLSQIQLNADLINKSISITKAQGYLTSDKYYTELMSLERTNLSQLKQKKNELVSAMKEAVSAGEIEEYSSAWNSMQSEINDVTEAIWDCDLALQEYQNSIRELDWSNLEYIHDTISQIIEESDFLIDLMSNSELFDADTGKMTDTGMATLGLHGLNYNTYMEQAKRYAEELREIEEEIAYDEYNTDLLEHRQELLKAQRDAILAAEDEKQSIKDLVSDGIESELDALQDLIDKYVEALEAQEDLYDYQKKVKKQTKEIASLEKQLSAYVNDSSEETKATIQKLQVNLADAQEELAEMQHKQYISDLKKILNNMYSEYERNLNTRLDDIDSVIENAIAAINGNSSNILATLQAVSTEVGYTLTDEMTNIWSPLADETGNIRDVLTTYSNNMAANMTTLQTTVQNIVSGINDMIAATNNLASSYISKAANDSKEVDTSNSSINTSTAKNTTNTNNKATNSTTTTDPLTQAKKTYGSKLVSGTFTDIPSGISAANKKLSAKNPVAYFIYKRGNKYEVRRVDYGDGTHSTTVESWGKYATGTRYNRQAGNYIVDDGNGQELIAHKTGGRLTSLELGDRVYNAGETNTLAKNLETLISKNGDVLTPVSYESLGINPAMLMQSAFGGFGNMGINKVAESLKNDYSASNNSSVQSSTTISIGNVSLPNVTNAQEFYVEIMKMAQKDKKFEQMVQSMTLGQINGKSVFEKHKIKW